MLLVLYVIRRFGKAGSRFCQIAMYRITVSQYLPGFRGRVSPT